MHDTSYELMRVLLATHVGEIGNCAVLDVGSRIVDGQRKSYRDLFPPTTNYTGLDIEKGKNVDVVVPTLQWVGLVDRFDLVISGQVIEHVEYPWQWLLQISMSLHLEGMAIIIGPSAGPEHRCPVDCWRVLPDGFRSIARYAGLQVVKCGYGFDVINSTSQWKDAYGVFRKKD